MLGELYKAVTIEIEPLRITNEVEEVVVGISRLGFSNKYKSY